jgi:hypothetical protein
MSEKKPIPTLATQTTPICPVCGKPSYSASGTHPQCAVARADAKSKAALKAAVPVISAAAKVGRSAGPKQCPKCKRDFVARRVVCDCGHQFVAIPSAR